MVERAINSSCMHFRPQPPMHVPLLKPHSFQGTSRNFTQQGRDVWTSKSAKANLRGIGLVRVTIIERSSGPSENQKSVEVCLEQNIDVYPLPDVPSITDVAPNRINNGGRLVKASLHGQPGVEIGHIVDSGHSGGDLLVDLI